MTQGDLVDHERTSGNTEVLVQSGVETVGYCLDETMIEFGTTVDDGHHVRWVELSHAAAVEQHPHRALQYLEMTSNNTESMWRIIGGLSLHGS